MPQRPIRIAGCSGSASDRRHALPAFAANHPTDPVDVIIGDWMSEMNMATKAAAKQTGKREAYERTFLDALEPALPDLATHRIKVVANAGASDTVGLFHAVTALVAAAGLDLKVAYTSGDHVLPTINAGLESGDSTFADMHTGVPLKDWQFAPVDAQAYLGGLGIAAALEKGADIVVCGRVSDASLVVGAAVWWHRWSASELDKLANALIAGHLIECSTYVCGGNFSGFTALDQAGWHDIGFPIAEIGEGGQVVITKQQGSGGIVTVDTCTAQVLYELQGPWYLNSDVTAVLDDISFEQLGADRVALHGVKGDLPPSTTKVGITAHGGFQAEIEFYLTGLDVPQKAAMVETQVRKILAPHSSQLSLLRFDLLGTPKENAKSQNEATVVLRTVAQAPKSEALAPNRFARLVLDTMMQSYPGATLNMDVRTAFPRPMYEYHVTRLPQASLKHTVHTPFHSAEQTTVIPPPAQTKSYGHQPDQPNTDFSTLKRKPITRGGTTDAAGGWAELPPPTGRSTLREIFGANGRTTKAPLGAVVHARSGDKGPDANLGIFLPAGASKGQWDWLRVLLSTNRVKDLLGQEWKGGKIERCEFAGLRAVHFVLKRHLDRGVGASSTVDVLGKNVAEFVRARHVDVPVGFLKKGKL